MPLEQTAHSGNVTLCYAGLASIGQQMVKAESGRKEYALNNNYDSQTASRTRDNEQVAIVNLYATITITSSIFGN